ncbi:MAG TPA: DNA-processing protein DprA [Gemmatimonadales bacterium]|nr:DNA-processing protein DprA [Gemmatimonadales bacterium]
MNDSRAAYLALALQPGIGPVRMRTLLDACGSALGAHSAPFAFLCALPGFSRALATAVREARPELGHDALRRAEAMGARVLLADDADFPESLRTIPDPPLALFARGELALLTRPAVAVVGSRDHTPYGAAACHEVVRAAVGAGLVVASGMARGLDAVAHAATLELGGATIGVLGNGLGVVYPAANRDLYRSVAERGLLLTEFAPGERPRVHTFPRRNRIISGLSRVTVVVEAAPGSGALITADAALEQGRDVLAVPGPITSPRSLGVNRLLRDGAGPFLEAEDLLAHYPELGGAGTRRPPAASGASAGAAGAQPSLFAPAPPDLDAEERCVLGALDAEPLQLERLLERTALPPAQLLSVLLRLELAGAVEQEPGRRFRRVVAV